MRKALLGALLLVPALLIGTASHAAPLASPGDADRQVEREFKEGIEKIFRAFDLMLRSVPQYATPEVLENGDIVIRRKPTPQPPARKERPPSRDGEWT